VEGVLGAKWGERLSLVGYSIGRKCNDENGRGVRGSSVHLIVINMRTDGFLKDTQLV